MDRTAVATVEGELRYDDVTSRFSLVDGTGEFDPRAGGGISSAQHQALRQLIHFIDDGPANGFASGAYKETSPAGPFPTSEIWYESVAKAKKLVSLDTTWSGAKITQEVWKVYDVDGSTALGTVTDVIAHSGIFETSRTRTIA